LPQHARERGMVSFEAHRKRFERLRGRDGGEIVTSRVRR